MGIQNFSEDVLLVTLPEQPQQGNELETVSRMLRGEADCDVLIDFCSVQMLTSETISGLIVLDGLLSVYGRQLVLCNVSPPIKGIFERAGLVAVFEFADTELAGLQRIRSASGFPT